MMRVRLLSDQPEGTRGSEVALPAARARELVGAEQAERIIDRSKDVERATR